ncbi:MAG: transcriptional regulator [Chloroflexi bacterium]|nr:MAG: transcriptional regulator [Chloroflexota bacterium]PIE79366.1 MAG: transcriptional regulator [Chloroflexota bacterium]
MDFNSHQIHLDDSQFVEDETPSLPIYLVSGNIGALGEQTVRTVLPQFQGVRWPIVKRPRILKIDQVVHIVNEAKETKGIIMHTLVDNDLRLFMNQYAMESDVLAIDLIGQLMEFLMQKLGQKPLGQPGLYRYKNQEYFDRIDAIEYTLDHDDGKNSGSWEHAEIIIAGPSRLGKTPLAIYLSVLGWRVANIPLVLGIPTPPKLFELDRRRVIGLTIEPTELLAFRQHRQNNLGVNKKSDYNNITILHEEIEEARRIFRKGRFKVINVTNKPIETTAAQVITTITRQLKS